jgi:hypothetical protein
MGFVEAFGSQPFYAVSRLHPADIPTEPGVYAWYRRGRLFYIGETHRGLRSRLWGNHIRGNTRGSTLRNKVAKAFGFEPSDRREYGAAAESQISAKLQECEVRLLALRPDQVSDAQQKLIDRFDPPMNDHPGEQPRWRLDLVRAILEINAATERLPPRGLVPIPNSDPTPPGWGAVERTLQDLAATNEWFPTATGKPNRIVAFEPGQRVRVETETGTNWVPVAWIKIHWQTLAEKREITRDDLLNPGRRSAFMLALFRQVPGVTLVSGPPATLRLLQPATANDVASRRNAWTREVATQLPRLLRSLLESDDCANRPPQTHGVYLFSEFGVPMYVGRTGHTERSRTAGKRGSSGFAARRRGHTQPDHNKGTYAYRLALERCRESGVALIGTRKQNCANPAFMKEFRRQCQRVKAMEFRTVTITDDKLAAVFEVYASTILGTANSWATS